MSSVDETTAVSLALPRLPRPALIAAVAAVVVVAGILVQPELGWAGLLTAAVYGSTLALGGAVFIAYNAVSKARWWFGVRHEAVALAQTYAAPAVAIVLTVALGLTTLYPWSNPEVVASSHILQSKAAWLNTPFFIARALIIVIIWGFLVVSLRRAVAVAFAEPTQRTATGLLRRGAMSLVLFAFSISVAYWDWAMSLEPEWFSTMYGVYGFAGVLQGGVAAIVFLSVLSARARRQVLPSNVLHDLGKLLFAFSFFWAYIWFCEAMLIWYANLPEETTHFATRLSGGWSVWFWLNPILNFVIPFLVLLSARVKRHSSTVFQVAMVVLAGRWLDVHLLVTPSVSAEAVTPIYSLAATVVMLIAMGMLYRRSAATAPTAEAPGVESSQTDSFAARRPRSTTRARRARGQLDSQPGSHQSTCVAGRAQ